jgi:hypothetical protein
MALTVLLNGVDLLVLRYHNFIKVNFVVQKVVELEPFKRLEHLIDLALELLYKGFVFNPQLALLQQCVFLVHALELLVKDSLKRCVVVVFGLYLFRFDVDYLPQLVKRV